MRAPPWHCARCGAAPPAECSPGSVTATPGLSKCERCEPGTFSLAGSQSCSECVAGTYAANPGQGQCVPCPHPLSSERGAVTCSVCQKDFYLLKSADPADIFSFPTDYCKPCPPNAECSDDTSLATLGVPAGYWRASPSSAVLTACRDFGGDKAGEARCAGNERGAEQASRLLEEAGSDEYCAPGFTGPLSGPGSPSGGTLPVPVLAVPVPPVPVSMPSLSETGSEGMPTALPPPGSMTVVLSARDACQPQNARG